MNTEAIRKKFEKSFPPNELLKFDDATQCYSVADQSKLIQMLLEDNDLFVQNLAWHGYQQAVKDMESEIAELTKQRDELKERMHAAEKYISESPCDPDIYQEQLDAYMAWKEIVSAQEGPSE